MDGDGHEDVIVGAFNAATGVPNGGQVNVYSGQGGEVIRTFTSTVANEQLGFDCVGLDDLDGDGAIDFFLSAANGNTVYFASGAAPCPADLDGSGDVGPSDLGALIAAWGAGGETDLNGSGETDASDLGVLIAAWGPCA